MRSTFIVALCILFNAITIHSARSEAVPYLYYYSTERGAFIIERADGTDSGVLTELDTLSDDRWILGPGWSPSGRWFAWYSWYSEHPRPGNYDAMLVDYEGSQPFSVRNQCSVSFMEWSPSEDMLLVGCYERGEQRNFLYLVFDANRQETAFIIDTATLGLSVFDFTPVYWTPDGEYLVIYPANSDDVGETAHTMKVFALDGSLVAESEFHAEHFSLSLPPRWSSSGNVAYVSSGGTGVVVENFQNGMRLEFETTLNEIGWGDWSPDGNYAFLYEGGVTDYIDEAENINPVWLLSIPDESLTLLSETARPLNLRRRTYPLSPTTTWSPAGNLGYIVDSPSTLSLVTPRTGDTVILHEVANSVGEIYPQFVRWHNDGESLTLVEYRSNTFFVYDVNSRQLLNTFDTRITSYDFSYSATGQYLAYGSLDCNGVCIIDTFNNETVQIPFLPDRNGVATESLWHPDEDWLIVTGNAESGSRWLIVANADGSVNRSLGWCSLAVACFGWMPDANS